MTSDLRNLAKKQKTILIVEDDPAILSIAQEVLSEDYNVKAANDGSMALSLAMTYHFDLIITDLYMPIMNGDELCGHIKTLISPPPVLLLQTTDGDEAQVLLEEGLVDDILTKPWSFAQLHAIIEKWLA